jgi:hypothetical protein
LTAIESPKSSRFICKEVKAGFIWNFGLYSNP